MISSNDTALRRDLARMLEAYALEQAELQRAAHRRRGRSPRTFRYTPSAFHSDACRILGYGDSEDVARVIHSYELRDHLGRV